MLLCLSRRNRTIRKCEGMVEYNLARCPMWGAHESPQYAKAQQLKEKIRTIEAKAKKRWEANFA